jgi:hypothetical protein
MAKRKNDGLQIEACANRERTPKRGPRMSDMIDIHTGFAAPALLNPTAYPALFGVGAGLSEPNP